MQFKFPFFIVLFVFCLVNTFSCKRDTSSNRTALDHAYACQDVLGPLPNFSCADAIEVPTTKNGTRVTFGPTAEGGNGSTNLDYKELIHKDGDKYTLFALAERSGFNSKSSFHSIFKELTGMTPNEYKRLN